MGQKSAKKRFQAHDLNWFAPYVILFVLFAGYPLGMYVWSKTSQVLGNFFAGVIAALVVVAAIFLLLRSQLESPLPLPGKEKMWRLGHVFVLVGSIFFVSPFMVAYLFVAITNDQSYLVLSAFVIPLGLLAFVLWYAGYTHIKKSSQWLAPPR